MQFMNSAFLSALLLAKIINANHDEVLANTDPSSCYYKYRDCWGCPDRGYSDDWCCRGQYAETNDLGWLTCWDCPIGTYKDLDFHTSPQCTSCLSTETTLAQGSTSSADCVCKPDTPTFNLRGVLYLFKIMLNV